MTQNAWLRNILIKLMSLKGKKVSVSVNTLINLGLVGRILVLQDVPREHCKKQTNRGSLFPKDLTMQTLIKVFIVTEVSLKHAHYSKIISFLPSLSHIE